MKKIYLLCLMLLCGLVSTAQDFEILKVEALLNDMSAKKEMKTDQDGRKCALLRIATKDITPAQREGFYFNADMGSEVVERANRDGEIWLWVSPGLKYLRIKHRELGQYELYLLDHVASVESLHTYKIVIRGTTTPPPPPATPTQQYLMFQITPANAMLEVDGQLWSVDADGIAMKYVNFGTYSYRVMAPDYFTETGKVTVDDPENTKVFPVSLEPNFAEITLTVDADAEIWVNNVKKGTRTWTGPLGNGTYKIECKQANHETSILSKEITPAMNRQTITLPAPTPIYGSLNVESTPNLATIYIDGKEVGKTPKSINEILIGQHEIRLTKEGYADYTGTVMIAKGERKQVNATLSNGKEIQFTCNVPHAQLEIDGQRVGSATGTYQLTYGSHSLRATATDYRDYTYTINVNESGSRSHSITMQGVSKNEETFTVNGVSFTMKLVEGGTFQMGSSDSDADSDEKPVHNVTLSNYYMGETEVTQELWKAVMGSNPSYFKGDKLPVENVSWNDCQDFIRKLNQKTGRNFRLPTEAEWEYAARGGTKTSLYNGENIIIRGKNNSPNLDRLAWYGGNCGRNYTTGEGCDVSNGYDISGWDEKQYSDSKGGTHPVKRKQPNDYGLYDMLGNVWEWCSDWYGSDYYGKSSSTNPQGPSTGSIRVLRGGSWGTIARNCRVSRRYCDDPDTWGDYLGFRLCLPQ